MVRLSAFSAFASVAAIAAMGFLGAAGSSEWDAAGGQRLVLAQAGPVKRPEILRERTPKVREVAATAEVGLRPETVTPVAVETTLPPDPVVPIEVDTASEPKVDIAPEPIAPEPAAADTAPAIAPAPANEPPAPEKVEAPTVAPTVQESPAPKAAAEVAVPVQPAAPAAPARPISRTGASSSDYRLTPGDKITVTVFGQTDLSGEYLIDDAGNITLPLAGVVSVARATVKESESNIAQSLADGFIRQPAVSVRISEHRPIFVVGDVKTPGSYPYRYGGTVLSAVAIAGGYGVAEAMPGVAAAEFMLVDERVRVLEANRMSLLVRQARVSAQLEHKTTFEAPYVPGLATDGADAHLETIFVQERQVMASQLAALEKEIGLQKLQKPRIESEITALLAQTEGQKRQLNLVIEQAEDYAKLDKMGLTRRATEVAMQRERAALESSVAGLDAGRARLGLMLGELDIKIQDLELANHRRLTAEQQEVRQKLQEIETTLPVVHELRQLRAQLAGGITGIDGEEVVRSIFIMRTTNGSVKTVAATPDMMLEPGDIVEVKRTRPRGLGATARQGIGVSPSAGLSTFGMALPPRGAVAENVAPR